MGKEDLLDRKALNCVKESLLERDTSESPHYNSLNIVKDGIYHMTSEPSQIALKWLIHNLLFCYYFSITANNTF